MVHSWLGLTVEETRKGLEVSYAIPGESAHRAGIVQSDIIRSINGIKVDSIEKVQELLVLLVPDTLVEIEWSHNGDVATGILSLGTRPEKPMDLALKRDIAANLIAPLFGMVLEETGSYFWEKTYAIRRIYPGSVADETGLSINDPLAIKNWHIDEENRIAFLQIIVKKRKAGFIERAVQLGAYLEIDNSI